MCRNSNNVFRRDNYLVIISLGLLLSIRYLTVQCKSLSKDSGIPDLPTTHIDGMTAIIGTSGGGVPSTVKIARRDGEANSVNKYTTDKRTKRAVRRTTPNAIEFDDPCEFQAAYCINVYVTGRICARSHYYQYYTFDSHCLLDYMNCVNRFNMWEIAYMGDCMNATVDVPVYDYMHYPAFNDYFMDDLYVITE